MGEGVQPGTPVDPNKPIQVGTGMSGPIYGQCPVGRDWLKESSGNPQTGRDWVTAPPNAPKHLDDTDNVMMHLAHKKINAFSGVGHGFYFWIVGHGGTPLVLHVGLGTGLDSNRRFEH